MKKNYKTPQVEVIEIELEGVLCGSGDNGVNQSASIIGFEDGEGAW